jgi:hypothetical protein
VPEDKNGKPPEAPPAPQANGAPAQQTPEDRPMTTTEFMRARDSMFADMRRMVEGIVKPAANGKGKESSPESAAPAPSGQPVDVQAAVRREQEISDAIGEHPHLSKEQRKALRRLVDLDRPDDIAGYVAGQAKLFAPGAQANNPSAAAPAPSGRPVSDGGAPAPAPTFTEDTPLWKLDQQSRDRLINEKGLSWYRATLRKQAKGVRVRLR